MLRNKTNGAFGAVTMIVAGLLLRATSGFEGEPADRLFPQIVLGLLLLSGVVLIASELRILRPRAEGTLAQRFELRHAVAAAASLAYPILAFEIGFYVTTFLFLLILPAAFIRTDRAAKSVHAAPAPVKVAIIYAAFTTAFLYASFQVFLKFSLPAGVLL